MLREVPQKLAIGVGVGKYLHEEIRCQKLGEGLAPSPVSRA
jgi:hypothetical protein